MNSFKYKSSLQYFRLIGKSFLNIRKHFSLHRKRFSQKENFFLIRSRNFTSLIRGPINLLESYRQTPPPPHITVAPRYKERVSMTNWTEAGEWDLLRTDFLRKQLFFSLINRVENCCNLNKTKKKYLMNFLLLQLRVIFHNMNIVWEKTTSVDSDKTRNENRLQSNKAICPRLRLNWEYQSAVIKNLWNLISGKSALLSFTMAPNILCKFAHHNINSAPP